MGRITQWQMEEVMKEIDRVMEPTLTTLNAQLQMKIDHITEPRYITVHEAFWKLSYNMTAYPSNKKLPPDETRDFYPEDLSDKERKEKGYYCGHSGPSMKVPAASIDLMEYTGSQKINERRAKKYHQKVMKVRESSMEAKRIAALYLARQAVMTRIALEGVAGATEAISAFKITCKDLS